MPDHASLVSLSRIVRTYALIHGIRNGNALARAMAKQGRPITRATAYNWWNGSSLPSRGALGPLSIVLGVPRWWLSDTVFVADAD